MPTETRDKILSFATCKGEKGSICVIGGSFEYSGAPYFSAISALRIGADLSFVICDINASNVIKSYSPELIVFGLLDQTADKPFIEFPAQITNRVSAIVVGPGLSRNMLILEQAKILLCSLKNKDIPIVFDGDGIYLLKNNYSLFEELFKSIIITPNVNEYKLIQALSIFSKNSIIYAKGENDYIIYRDGRQVEISDEGAPRRCGGIGDVLSGVIAAILSMHGSSHFITFDEEIECLMLSGKIVRGATKLAFVIKKRSMSALDVIGFLGPSFEQIFE